MSKKSTAKNQPIELDETPPQDDELILDTEVVTSRDRIERAKARQAERRNRSGGGSRSSAAKAANPYTTRTARERRAERGEGGAVALSPERVAELLHNPTKEVSTEELKRDYAYVIRDLRGMAILAAALIVVLIGLALVLPPL